MSNTTAPPPAANISWRRAAFGQAEMSADVKVGDRVSVREKSCTVRFVGSTQFAEGPWIGVDFGMPCGRNDGSVDGVQYFECAPRHGLFVRPGQVNDAAGALQREERAAPKDHVDAWAAAEMVMEKEAMEAGRAQERVHRHLERVAGEQGLGARRPVPAGKGASRIKRLVPSRAARCASPSAPTSRAASVRSTGCA